MKRILCVLSVLALTISVAGAAESRLQNYVNKKLEPVTKKEQELNAKAEANRKAHEAKKAEWQKQQEANRKAHEAKKAEWQKQQEANKKAAEARQAQRQAEFDKQRKAAEARRQNTKNAIQAEKDYWKSLKK